MIAIGTSGWSYDHWTPQLYPPGLAARDRLARYMATFSTVELNSSFYRWPRDGTFRSWHDRLPAGFALSVKAPRGLTHAKKLYEPEGWVRRISRSWRELDDARLPWPVQLPPTLPRDDQRLDYFLRRLPERLRIAVEFRHSSWNHEDVFHLLERYSAAYRVMQRRRSALHPAGHGDLFTCASLMAPTGTTCTGAHTATPTWLVAGPY